MFGEPVTSCHMRVPVSSSPKYCSVSRFSKTDSRSKRRTRTWVGVAALSVNETIGTAPPGNFPALHSTARVDYPSTVFYRGLFEFATYGRTEEVASLSARDQGPDCVRREDRL